MPALIGASPLRERNGSETFAARPAAMLCAPARPFPQRQGLLKLHAADARAGYGGDGGL